ncbi:MAG: glycosyltransferase family 2 protein [Opitutaceae bacterium]|nr:glycosyltransferase family 2 protein [Opitutaceae bacterium]
MAESPTQIEHWLPPGAKPEPVELSIVVPALNEQVTIGEFVDWCREGIRRAGVTGQILIVDSSTDATPDLARAHGAEVLRVPKRGLGRAYIDAIPFIRGQWVIMGDADLTYDFRELEPFVEKFRAGDEMVMGSRFKGEIEPGAMPPLHRYFGTPLTTWILNRLYGSRFSDIHCGMRGLTRDALLRIRLRSQSWEYASEMVLKAARKGLRIAEVPVRFYRDRDGRVSHHRRAGWMSPWIAGWLNLRVMLVYSPDSFVFKPGLALFAAGFALCAALAAGPINLGKIQLNLHSMLLALVAAVLGYACVQLGVLARLMHGLRPESTRTWLACFSYNRGVLSGAGLSLAGVALFVPLLREYFAQGFRLVGFSHAAIFGLLLLITGFQTFVFTLLLEIAKRVVHESNRE